MNCSYKSAFNMRRYMSQIGLEKQKKKRGKLGFILFFSSSFPLQSPAQLLKRVGHTKHILRFYFKVYSGMLFAHIFSA